MPKLLEQVIMETIFTKPYLYQYLTKREQYLLENKKTYKYFCKQFMITTEGMNIDQQATLLSDLLVSLFKVKHIRMISKDKNKKVK